MTTPPDNNQNERPLFYRHFVFDFDDYEAYSGTDDSLNFVNANDRSLSFGVICCYFDGIPPLIKGKDEPKEESGAEKGQRASLPLQKDKDESLLLLKSQEDSDSESESDREKEPPHNWYDDHCYLLIGKRRCTIAYETLLRNKYAPALLEQHVHNLTHDEYTRLTTHDFQTLWSDLLLSKRSRFFGQREEEFKETKKTIAEIRIGEFKNKTAPWIFPKGKRKGIETPTETSWREFFEETNFQKRTFSAKQIPNLCFLERFKGCDLKVYSTIYFVAKANEKYSAPIRKLDSKLRPQTISDEIEELVWTPLKEAKTILGKRKTLVDLFEKSLQKADYYT